MEVWDCPPATICLPSPSHRLQSTIIDGDSTRKRAGTDNMNWWKILIAYCLFLGALLWFLHRSRRYFEDGEQAPRD
jgi:hypothetical protein